MKRHVPDLHTDFIYSVGAEEYGLIFSLLLISLFAFVVIRGLYRAMKLNDPFEQVAAAGLFVLVGQQAFINVAVNLNMIPDQGHDPALHQLWRLLDAGHGPDARHGAGAHPSAARRLHPQRRPRQGRRVH